jgi:hypothetical protein
MVPAFDLENIEDVTVSFLPLNSEYQQPLVALLAFC